LLAIASRLNDTPRQTSSFRVLAIGRRSNA
jgi:hypothetical protein